MLGQKVRAALKLSRPFTLMAPAVGGLLFSYIAFLHSPGPIYKIPLTVLILVFANYASNVINQVYDREIDMINKPYRPIPAGEISVDEASSLAILLTIATIGLAYALIGSLFGTLLSIILAFAWMYSAPPLRLRSRLLLSNLALATPRGALGILTAYSAYANPFENHGLLLLALGMAIYVFGGNTFKDIPDEEGDRRCGVRNFVTVYGRRKAIQISLACVILSYPFILASLDNPLFSIPFAAIIIAMVFFGIRHPDLRTKTENTVLWTLFYLGMLAGFLSYAISAIGTLLC